MKPLAITAMAAMNGMAPSLDGVLACLDAGESGLRPSRSITELSLPFETWIGAVEGPLQPVEDAAFDTRLARMGWASLRAMAEAIRGARERWGARRIALLVGTSTGGLDSTELAYSDWHRDGALPAGFDLRTKHDFHAFAEFARRQLGLEGPCYVLSTACSSSAKVHASASRLIELGLIDAAIVGGIDSLCRMTLHGFHGLGILSSSRCRPFSAERDGINIGEGAAWMLLEKRGLEVERRALAWVLGVGESSDAYNMSSPEPNGRGAREAMQRALLAAGADASRVSLVLAHGTATEQNDMAEARAIVSVFGEAMRTVSTKAYTGHQLGAAGATSAVFAAHAARTRRAPASLGLETLDPTITLHVPRDPEPLDGPLVLANAFAFGGSNVSLAIAATPELP